MKPSQTPSNRPASTHGWNLFQFLSCLALSLLLCSTAARGADAAAATPLDELSLGLKKEPGWKIVAAWKGTEKQTTAPFTIATKPWRLRWKTTADSAALEPYVSFRAYVCPRGREAYLEKMEATSSGPGFGFVESTGEFVLKLGAINASYCIVAEEKVLKAPERSAEQIDAAKQFAFEGLPFGTSTAAFKLKFPAAKPSPSLSDPKAGTELFTVTGLDSIDHAELLFMAGKLAEVRLWHDREQVEKAGGWEAIKNKLVAKFGEPDADSEGPTIANSATMANYKWQFVDSSCRISLLWLRTGAVTVTYTDRELAKPAAAKHE